MDTSRCTEKCHHPIYPCSWVQKWAIFLYSSNFVCIDYTAIFLQTSHYRHVSVTVSKPFSRSKTGGVTWYRVLPTFPYGNFSIQQSLYVNSAMQSPHSAVPTTSRSMLKIDEFGRWWFKFYSHNKSAQYILPAFACILYCISELCLVIVMFLCLCLSFWCFLSFSFFGGWMYMDQQRFVVGFG